MPTANLNDVQIYYEEPGQGEPVLLAPPSWWPSDTWKIGVVPFLSKRYRTIIFDCRGTGYSSKPTDGYTIAQFAKDCAGLLEHLKIARCHAVGFALGGQIVQALAIDRPDLVATLTIAAAGAGMKATSGAPREVRNTDEEEIRAHGFEAFIRGHIENTHMAFNAEFYRDHPDVVKALSDALWQRQTSPEQHRYHFEARRTVGHPRQCAEGQGADAHPLRRGGRRQSRRQHAGRHGAQTRRIGSRLRACARAQCKAYDFLGRRRRACGVAGLSRAPSNSVTNETSTVGLIRRRDRHMKLRLSIVCIVAALVNLSRDRWRLRARQG